MEKAKKIGLTILAVIVVLIIIGTAIFFVRSSTQRKLKDIQSEYSGGLDRTVNVYSFDGKKIATYKGIIDVAEHDGNVVKFELKGKRYIYYNALVEVVEN
ncbi:MAG: hypothetical protein IKF54_03840 [Eubacterium sp.]|nr:hypothetical protein [Eubacterium sp.]